MLFNAPPVCFVSLRDSLLSLFLHFSLPFCLSCSHTSPGRHTIKSIHSCHCSFLHTLRKRDDGASVFLPENDVFIHLHWTKNCPSLALLKRSHLISIKKMKETCRHRIKIDRKLEAGSTRENDLPIYCMFQHVPYQPSMMVSTGYRCYLAGFDARRCENVMDAGWLFPPSKGAWIGCTVTVCRHTHTRASVHAHFHPLISTDGHHNGESRSQQFPPLPSASWPRRVQSLSPCPGPGPLSQPPQPTLHGFCDLMVQKKPQNIFFLYCNMKRWFGPGLHTWQWWWFSTTPKGSSGLLTLAYACIFMHVYPNTHTRLHCFDLNLSCSCLPSTFLANAEVCEICLSFAALWPQRTAFCHNWRGTPWRPVHIFHQWE